MSATVRLRLVCTDEGRHKERELATFDHDPLREEPLQRVVGRASWDADPAGMPFDEWSHTQRRFLDTSRGRRRADENEARVPVDLERIRAECPTCRVTPTYRSSTLVRVASTVAGGTFTIDVSTGATVHKQ